MNDGVPPARLRASHTDRERVIAVLRSAVEDGRLDLAEFEERADRVYRARTLGDLPPVTADLVPAAAQPIRLHTEPMVALFSGVERSGRWVVRPREGAAALGGTLRLDLRDALLVRDRVRMTAWAVFGRIDVQVPDGVDVRVRGWSFLGRRTTSVRRPRRDDAPVLEIDGFCLFGSLAVRAPRRRRAWLPRRRRAHELE
ncbi:DUF1707 SHOCT-like domain-containing protein [Nocardiopsis trehalosi]|uniref:DUF1707 SHOCT-like domain-containing protein n=1 Tax=Nocardiopsis trehalosi TaxID=109329 RepID=UPI00082BE9FF|nr:DUF1707 domain-containing protein [Nocardiopsis trehalosi]